MNMDLTKHLLRKPYPAVRPRAVRRVGRALLATTIALCAVGRAWAEPCSELVQTPRGAEKSAIAVELAKQLHVARATIKQAYRSEDWRLFDVVTSDLDRTYVIYSDDPRNARYVTLWGGMPDDYTDAQVLDWTHANAPGIPEPLAACLAWTARQDRPPL